MEKEENVHVEFVQTSGAEAQEKETSGLGKFKDVDALLKAYGCLQAEFTRRSQRLKELEREAENRKKSEKETAIGDGLKGVEKLRETAKARKAVTAQFDAFVSDIERGEGENQSGEIRPESDCEGETGGAGMRITALNEEMSEKKVNEETEEVSTDNGLGEEENKALETVEKESGENGSSVQSSRENAHIPSRDLYELVNRDEEVRLKVIGDYLSSLKKNGAPLTVSGAGAVLAPPLKARTIGEAGTMALRWFQKENVE